MRRRIRAILPLSALTSTALAFALAGAVAAEETAAGARAPSGETSEKGAASEDAEGPRTVGEGRTVSIEYTLTLGDGSEAGSNVDGKPLTFEHGKHQILPALEEELEGMEVDDATTVTLPPQKGYGEHDPEALQAVPASRIPEEARSEGAVLMMQGPEGQQRPVRVHELKEEEVVLDLNHPLAGKTLTFDVKVVDIE